MIEIKFQGNTMENILRQIAAFAENVAVKESKKGKHEPRQPRPVVDEMKEPVVGYQYNGKR